MFYNFLTLIGLGTLSLDAVAAFFTILIFGGVLIGWALDYILRDYGFGPIGNFLMVLMTVFATMGLWNAYMRPLSQPDFFMIAGACCATTIVIMLSGALFKKYGY
jgi:hypothetical protein